MKDKKNKSLIHEYSMISNRFKENHEKYWKVSFNIPIDSGYTQ